MTPTQLQEPAPNEMQMALARASFKASLEPGDAAVVYYARHAVQASNRNYLNLSQRRRRQTVGICSLANFVDQKYAVGGAGWSQNKVEALKWFILAAARGDVIGQNYLRVLSKNLSAKENAKALRLADEWLEAHP